MVVILSKFILMGKMKSFCPSLLSDFSWNRIKKGTETYPSLVLKTYFVDCPVLFYQRDYSTNFKYEHFNDDGTVIATGMTNEKNVASLLQKHVDING